MTSKFLATNCGIVDYDNSGVLTSKNLISKTEKSGGRQHLPFAFTEQGIYMLMTVLKGDLATEQSKVLIRIFKEMKDFIVDNRYLGTGRRQNILTAACLWHAAFRRASPPHTKQRGCAVWGY